MSENVVEQRLQITNELGMHARAATKFVQTANKFQSAVAVEKDGQSVNGKSIMGVLMLVAAKGTLDPGALHRSRRAGGHGGAGRAGEGQVRGGLGTSDERRGRPDAGGQGSAGQPTLLRGVGASPGLAVGRAFIVDRRRVKTPKRHIADEEVAAEIARFDAALGASNEQLERVKKKLAEREGEDHFHILEAHQLILHDEHLVEPTRRRIREERVNAEWALRRTVEEIKTVFDAIEEDYFRERRCDVDFVGDRILRNLLGVDAGPAMPPPGAVIVAHDLSPADTAHLHRALVRGLLHRRRRQDLALGDPGARVRDPERWWALENVTEHVGNGDYVIVDGLRGRGHRAAVGGADRRVSRARAAAPDVRPRAAQEPRPAGRDHRRRARAPVRQRRAHRGGAVARSSTAPRASACTAPSSCTSIARPADARRSTSSTRAACSGALHPFPGTFRTFDLGGDKVVPFAGARRRGEPGARAALDPPLPARAQALQGAAARPFARVGARAHAHHVPDDLGRRRAARGQGGARGGARRAGARGRRRSTRRCRSGSWSRCRRR